MRKGSRTGSRGQAVKEGKHRSGRRSRTGSRRQATDDRTRGQAAYNRY